jgi:hypothetical protein
MATAPKRPDDSTAIDYDFYIPAASIPKSVGRVETLLRRYFGRHGRIPIPRSYNK